jgi:hypothetical protein
VCSTSEGQLNGATRSAGLLARISAYRKQLCGTGATPAKDRRVSKWAVVDYYLSGKPRDERVESERWKSFTYDELIHRDKVNLDITWLRDESLEDAENLPAPEVIAREIVEDLTAALVEFEAVAVALEAAADE